MLTHEAAQFPRRFLIPKRNGQIASCKASIFSGTHPRTSAKELAKREEKRQRQRRRNGRPGAIKNINDKIRHCASGSASPKTINAFGERVPPSARQGRFACSSLQPI